MSTEKDYLLTVNPTTEANWYNENARTEGLLLRDYFAAKVMAGAQSNIELNDWGAERYAQYAYEVADAMLKARNQ
jgi:hypothetical protein